MNAVNKTTIVDPEKMPSAAEISRWQAARAVIEMRKTNIAGEYGFRIRLLSDATGDTRLIMAATQYADDYAIGIEGVRGERMGLGVQTDYASSADGYTQTRIDALTRLSKTNQALGIIHQPMVYNVVIAGLGASAIGRILGVSDKTAAVRAREALDKLANIYEGKVK
jgi:hypothetical protein